MKYEYDVALSFAGEERGYVEKIAEILHAAGLKIFYDKYEEIDLWGKNLFTHLDDVYRKKAKYCVMFISKNYKLKVWTNHERESAQNRALESKNEYILPIKFDTTILPGLRTTTHYLNVKNNSPEELAEKILKKIDPNSDIKNMIKFMEDWLSDYKITIKGTDIIFKCEKEDYYGEFPLRLLLEMYRLNLLKDMFLIPAIVPC